MKTETADGLLRALTLPRHMFLSRAISAGAQAMIANVDTLRQIPALTEVMVPVNLMYSASRDGVLCVSASNKRNG